MTELKDSDLDKEINNDLQNELLELAELYPDSEEEDILQIENDEDDEGLFENDYETIEQGFQPNVPLQDPLLKLLKVEYDDSIFYNTDEENEVIMHCTDGDLQALLIKNRVRAKQLRVLRNKLVKILQGSMEKAQCSTATKDVNAYLTMPKLDMWKLGIPYFKDSQFYRCPENSDEITKRNKNEFSMFDFSVGLRWTANQQVTLGTTIENCYYKYFLNEILRKINTLKVRIKKGVGVKKATNELSKLKKELNEIQSNPSKYRNPPRFCDTGVDWSSVADSFKGRRTVNECKAMWNVYLHPQINKNFWTDEENERIKVLVEKHNRKNWDLIAKELNTNRSGYLVFLNYFSNLWNKFKNERFQPSEDEYLLKIVDRCRLGDFIPWREVSLFFQDRSKQQLYHRYKYYLSKTDIIKGAFSEAEDILIMYLVGKFGKDYSKCARFMANRTSVQIRNRYSIYLDKFHNSFGQYTEADDQRIMDYVKVNGTKCWSSLAIAMNRARSHVRQRYITLCKWQEKSKSNQNLKNIPSRNLSFFTKQNGERQRKMQDVVQKLKKYPGEVNLDVVKTYLKQKEEEKNLKRKPWRVNKKKHSPSFIDKQLLDFFKGTCKIQREYKAYGEQTIKDSAVRVGKLVELLAGSAELLSNIKEDDANFTERENEVVTVLKNSVSDKPAGVSSSFLSSQLRFLLPPTLNTVLGLRGLIVKYQIHKNSTSKNSNAELWTIEQNLVQHGDEAKRNIERDRRLFLERFYVLFKWPSIVSKFFPEQLEKSSFEEVIEAVDHIEHQAPKRSRGRPPKTENPKIAQMLNGRKRKTFDCDDLNTTDVSVVLPRHKLLDRKIKNEKKDAHRLNYLKPKSKSENVTNAPAEVPVSGITITADVLERIRKSYKIVVLEKPGTNIIQGLTPINIMPIPQVLVHHTKSNVESEKLVLNEHSADVNDET